MVRVKPAAEAKAAYVESIPKVADKYKRGVARTEDWQGKALDGQKLFEEQMSDPAVLKRRAAGIAKTSNETWKKNTTELGGQRIGAGMKQNADKQAANWAPYREVIQNTDLPARTSDPATNVTNRVIPLAVNLANKKKELKG